MRTIRSNENVGHPGPPYKFQHILELYRLALSVLSKVSKATGFEGITALSPSEILIVQMSKAHRVDKIIRERNPKLLGELAVCKVIMDNIAFTLPSRSLQNGTPILFGKVRIWVADRKVVRQIVTTNADRKREPPCFGVLWVLLKINSIRLEVDCHKTILLVI